MPWSCKAASGTSKITVDYYGLTLETDIKNWETIGAPVEGSAFQE